MAPRVLWVTNLAPPYRLPVWQHIGTQLPLRVGLLESNERLLADHTANRGSDWRVADGTTYDSVEYRTHRITRGEDRHYTLVRSSAFRDLRSADAVLLGGWDSPAYWQLLTSAKAMNKGTVGFYESTLASQSRPGGPVGRARSAFFRQLDDVVVPGPSAREAIAAMGVPSSRIHVGFNAIDTATFQSAPKFPRSAGHRYLFVGQLIERKNVAHIMTSFAHIARPDDSLTIVGRGDQGTFLKELATSEGIHDQMSFIDFVPNKDLPEIMARHDTLVLASRVEVWGLVVNEALASGMQAVVTQNCGVSASVAGMPGVYLAAADASDLPEVLARARDGYTGRISSPPICDQTPARFADVFIQAFDSAARRHSRRGIRAALRKEPA